MSNLRAKMQVQSVETTTYSENVKLSCVYGGSSNAEDNTFAKATPSGGMTLQIDNPTAKGILKPGDVVYVDVTLARDQNKNYGGS
jgi:hypothetical protein